MQGARYAAEPYKGICMCPHFSTHAGVAFVTSTHATRHPWPRKGTVYQLVFVFVAPAGAETRSCGARPLYSNCTCELFFINPKGALSMRLPLGSMCQSFLKVNVNGSLSLRVPYGVPSFDANLAKGGTHQSRQVSKSQDWCSPPARLTTLPTPG